MKIFLGADHNGYHLKERIEKYLISRGYDVVDEIGKVRTAPGDRPLEPIVLKKVTILK